LAESGAKIVLGSRDAERAIGIAKELRAQWPELTLDIAGADNAGAASADVVIVATPWDSAIATLKPLRELLAGKVVVSMANALIKEGREMLIVRLTPTGRVGRWYRPRWRPAGETVGGADPDRWTPGQEAQPQRPA